MRSSNEDKNMLRYIDQRVTSLDEQIKATKAQATHYVNQRKTLMGFRKSIPGGTGPIKKRRALRTSAGNGAPPTTGKRRGRPPKA